MQRPRAKSAPTSRSKVRKTNALKEIEEWVSGGRIGEPETSRIHSGQLAENITEERLLRARIMELGKERFKILSKWDHDIQTFKETQKKKGFAFKKLRHKSAGGAADRVVGKPDGEIKTKFRVVRPKTVQFESNLARGEYLSTGLVEPRPKTVPSKMLLNSTTTLEEWNPIAMSTDWSRPSTGKTSGGSRPVSAYSLSSLKNNIKPVRESSSTDPRFAKLANSLSSNYKTVCKNDVPTIIQNIEALQKPLRVSSKEARRELEIKIRQFMKENNIVF